MKNTKQKKKIGIIFESFSESGGSGINTYINTIYCYLKSNYCLDIIRVSSTKKEMIDYDYDIQEFYKVPSKLHDVAHFVVPTLLPVISKNLKKEKYLLVHTQGLQCPSSRDVAYLKFKKKIKAKLLITQHGWPECPASFSLFAKQYLKYVGSRILKHADMVITVSESVKRQLKPFYEGEIIVIPNGIDTDLFKPKNKDKLQKKWAISSKSFLLYVGRLSREKNLMNLLKAMRYIDIPLIIVGEGNQRRKIDSYINKNNLYKKIKLLGYKPRIEVCELMNLAKITILPSTVEGFGLTLAESMAAGTPVIGSNIGGIPELIKDGRNGILINDPERPLEIAKSVNRLLRNENLYNYISSVSREYVIENYSLAEMIKKTRSVYNKLLNDEE